MEPLIIPGLIKRHQWRAMDPAHGYSLLGNVRSIVVHISETPDHDQLAPERRALSIQGDHMLRRSDRKPPLQNFNDIGYHFLIGQDGEILEGRPVTAKGAHVGGHNSGRIGVCVLGDHEFPVAQQEALLYLLESLIAHFNLRESDVIPHSAINDTDCPGELVSEWLEAYHDRDET